MEYRTYDLPASFPMIMLTGDDWHISDVPSGILHFHNCMEIGLCHSDGGTMLLNRTEAAFRAGDVTCIARNVPHTTWSDRGKASLWSYLFLDPAGLLDNAFLLNQLPQEQNLSGFLSDCHLILPRERYPWAGPLVRAILRELEREEPGYRTCVRGLCTALVVGLLRAYNENSGGAGQGGFVHAISPAIDYINAHFMEDFPLERLASVCDLSPSHFRRLFKEQMGMTPLAFLHQTRILKSCTLLRTTERAISEVAARVGYDSLSCYNRRFLEVMGTTPSAWRRTPEGNLRPVLHSHAGWTRAESPTDSSDE